jgi:hypothetical protein
MLSLEIMSYLEKSFVLSEKSVYKSISMDPGPLLCSCIHRVRILVERNRVSVSAHTVGAWSVHCNFVGYVMVTTYTSERGWACTPHPHQPGLIFPFMMECTPKKRRLPLCVYSVVSSKEFTVK